MESAPAAAPLKNAMAFFDGQNLFRHAKEAFGYHYPNFDPIAMHKAVCAEQGWRPTLTRFYTGVPDRIHSPQWTDYWNNRVLALKRAGAFVTTRPIRYREKNAYNEKGENSPVVVPQEKGIDVRIALDIVMCAIKRQFDVVILFSQDQDLAEIVVDVKEIAKIQGRIIEVACAFPVSATCSSRRGIDKTNWLTMNKEFYDRCLDNRDYRPKA